jgi:hypothetical protein
MFVAAALKACAACFAGRWSHRRIPSCGWTTCASCAHASAPSVSQDTCRVWSVESLTPSRNKNKKWSMMN